MNGTPSRRRTDTRAPELPQRRQLRISERQLITSGGTALWLSTTIVMVIASFIPAAAPDNVEFWRVALGLPAVCFAIANALLGPRLPDRYFQLWVELNMIPALAVNAVLLQITPATQGVLFNMIATLVFAGYFTRLPALMMTLGGGVVIAVSGAFVGLPSETPQIDSFLVVYITTIVLTTGMLFLQNSETLGALAKTRHRGLSDPLTGLANSHALRRAARKMLSPQAIKRAGDTIPGLLLIDLDNFKSANSRHGHLGGDYALRMIADQMLRVAPRGAVVARVGGDEFAVLMRAESRAGIEEIGQMFRAAVRAAGSIMDLEGVEIDAAVGIATFPDDGRDLSELLDVADRSMYSVKGAKRHNVPNFERVVPETEARPEWMDAAPQEHDEQRGLTLDDITGGRLSALARRSIYARTTALGWAIGAVVIPASLLMPDAFPDPRLPWWLILGGGLFFSLLILLANAKAQSRFHLGLDLASMAGMAIVIAGTGGIASAAAPLLILHVATQAMFWQTRLVLLRLVGPILVTISPLVYTSFGGSSAEVLQFVTLYALVAIILTVVAAMYFDRLILSRLQDYADYLAATDPLTDIANRRSFDAYVQGLIDGGEHDQFAIVMLDLDNFKQVNTRLGHRAGDQVLREIAASLSAVARADDCIARIGGDEFAAVLPGVGVDGARALAERLVAAVAATPSAEQSDVSASAGFALSPLHGKTLDQLVFTADTALMAVKATGKGSARVARIVSAVS